MKIEFGCGDKPMREGFKTCDIRDLPGVDFACPAWEIDEHVEDNSVDEIFSRHFFEHLNFIEGEIVLRKWHKILRKNGVCEMILPNMTFHVNQWIKLRNDPRQFRHAKVGFWGWQRGSTHDHWDAHKSGYDFESLSELLKNKGYRNIESLQPVTSCHLHVRCHKS